MHRTLDGRITKEMNGPKWHKCDEAYHWLLQVHIIFVLILLFILQLNTPLDICRDIAIMANTGNEVYVPMDLIDHARFMKGI